MIVFVWQLLQLDLRIFYHRAIHGIFRYFYDKYVAVDMGNCVCNQKDAASASNNHQQSAGNVVDSVMSSNNSSNGGQDQQPRNSRRRRSSSPRHNNPTRQKIDIDGLVLHTLDLIRTLVEK